MNDSPIQEEKVYRLGWKAPFENRYRTKKIRQYARVHRIDHTLPNGSTEDRYKLDWITNGGFANGGVHANYTVIGDTYWKDGRHIPNRTSLAKTSVSLEDAMAVANARLSGKLKNKPHVFRAWKASLKPKKLAEELAVQENGICTGLHPHRCNCTEARQMEQDHRNANQGLYNAVDSFMREGDAIDFRF